MHSELRSFRQGLPELESRGVHVVAISVDPPEVNRRQRQKLGYIDSSGIIRWVNLTENVAVRARPEQVLEAFEQGRQATAY
jgi:hypothetical protein